MIMYLLNKMGKNSSRETYYRCNKVKSSVKFEREMVKSEKPEK